MIGRRSAVRALRITRHRGEGVSETTKDAVAVEEPLEIRVSWSDGTGPRRSEPLAVTMRTPGEDFELAAGFLHGEGIVREAADLLEITYCRGTSGEPQALNVVEARLRPGVPFDPEAMRRNVYTTSSCGVCGKASLEAVSAIGCAPIDGEGLRIEPDLLAELPDRLLEGQDAFARTGGLHAAGLFDESGEPLLVREDVGRHNAVDKVIGSALLGRRLPASRCTLVVSGRASFEVVQKAVAAGVPVLVAVGAPSSLAVDLAERFGQTLVGFAREGGFNVYTSPERIA